MKLFHSFTVTLAVLTAQAALAAQFAGAKQLREHPVEKVIALLKDLSAKAVKEGKDEELIFDKFTHWCTTSLKTLDAALSEEKEMIEQLETRISAETTSIDVLAKEIEQLEAELLQLAKSAEQSELARKDGRAVYAQANQDYAATIDAIKAAVNSLESSKTPSLVQAFARTPAAVRSQLFAAVTMLERRPFTESALAALLQTGQRPDVLAAGDQAAHVKAYDFKSGGVIGLLKELLRKFEDESHATTIAETNAENAYALEKQARDNTIAAASKSKEEKGVAKSNTEQDLASDKNKLQETKADFEVDSSSRASTDESCTIKTQEWHTKSQKRAEEVEAMKQAIAILAEVAGVRTQAPMNPRLPVSPLEETSQVMLPPVTTEATTGAEATPPPEAKAGPQPGPPVLNQVGASFLQVNSVSDPRQQALKLVLARAKATHSKALAHLAQELSVHLNDPFRELINEIEKMIFRLNAEQTDEDNHKNWCDQEISKTTISQKDKQEKTQALGQSINVKETTSQSLTFDVQELHNMVQKLESFQAEAQEIRKIGKQENEASMKDAQDAQQAISDAVAVLTAYYKKTGVVAKAAWELVQKPVELPASPANWDASYTGVADPKAQPAGIITVLEEVASNFATMEADTRAEEAADQHAFEEQMKATSIAKTEKMKEAEMKTQENQRLIAQIAELTQEKKHIVDELEAVNQYLKDLEPACMSGNSTYEARKGARSDEIEALKEAQQILADHAKDKASQVPGSVPETIEVTLDTNTTTAANSDPDSVVETAAAEVQGTNQNPSTLKEEGPRAPTFLAIKRH